MITCKACGYESGYDFIDGKCTEIGNEDFLMIGEHVVRNTDYYSGVHVVNLYGCPKCGTVRYE